MPYLFLLHFCVPLCFMIVLYNHIRSISIILIHKFPFLFLYSFYKKYAFPSCKDAKFALATLGNDAGIYGAAKLML